LSDNPAIEKRPGRTVIKVSGPDAEKLLHDVLTGHIVAEAGPARWWALLTPQGKILAEGLCSFAEDGFWLDLDIGVAENFFKRMRMYKLRAKAEIAELSETHAVGWSDAPVPGTVCDADSRSDTLGYRVIAPKPETTDWADGDGFLARRIDFGLCELGPDFAADATFPHDIAMDLLGGIDFDKGCYIGQEVVSRMKHRGTARRRPVIVSGEGLISGASVMAGSREAGTLGAVHNGRGVAILRLDRITDSDAVTVDGRPATLALPSWASYRFGDSGGGGDD
jgi:tRNA-modifying protein YgfZ